MYPIQNYVQTSMENCLLKAFRKIENGETMEKSLFSLLRSASDDS